MNKNYLGRLYSIEKIIEKHTIRKACLKGFDFSELN